MTETQIAILGIILGGAVSWVISLFFFRKTVKKRLGAYIQFSSAVLGGIDDSTVREGLEIRYRGTKIDDLLQLQFVIANEGERAIRDVIEPLSLTLPRNAKLLDGRVLHTQPEGRKVEVRWSEDSDGKTRIELPFSVLNKGEFFIVKLLINGKLDASRLQFKIAVDDLPPVIGPRHRPFASEAGERISGWPAVLVGLVPLAVALATAMGMLRLSKAQPALLPGGAGFAWFSWSSLILLLWLGGVIYWFIRSANLIVARGFFGPKQRFMLPPREMPASLATQYDLELLRELDPEFAAYLRRRTGVSHYQMLRHYRRLREVQDEPTDPDPDNQAQ